MAISFSTFFIQIYSDTLPNLNYSEYYLFHPYRTKSDKIVQYIKDKKTVYAYYNEYGYNVRSRAEVQISRIKRCIGESFKTQKLESQKTEGIIISNIINLWNSFGQPTTVKV